MVEKTLFWLIFGVKFYTVFCIFFHLIVYNNYLLEIIVNFFHIFN